MALIITKKDIAALRREWKAGRGLFCSFEWTAEKDGKVFM